MRNPKLYPVECEECHKRMDVVHFKWAYHYSCPKRRHGNPPPEFVLVEEQPES